MDSLELYNFNEEESLSYNITIKAGRVDMVLHG